MNSNEDYLDQLLSQMKTEEVSLKEETTQTQEVSPKEDTTQIEEVSPKEETTRKEETMLNEESSQVDEFSLTEENLINDDTMQFVNEMPEENNLGVDSDNSDDIFSPLDEDLSNLDGDADDIGMDIDAFASQTEKEIMDSQSKEDNDIDFDALLGDSENEDEKAIFELLEKDENQEVIEQPEPDEYDNFDVMAAIHDMDSEDSAKEKKSKKERVKKEKRKKVPKEKKGKEKTAKEESNKENSINKQESKRSKLRGLFRKEKTVGPTESLPIEHEKSRIENPFDDIDKVFEEYQSIDAREAKENDISAIPNGAVDGTDITDMLNSTVNEEPQVDGLEDDYLQALLSDVNGEEEKTNISGAKTEEKAAKKKKKGLLERIIDALTETEEDTNQEELSIMLSEENQEILRTLEDKDEPVKGKNKKKKSKKDSKEEGEEKKEKKEKKEKNEKKEKKPKKTPKLSEVDLTPPKKLSKRRVLLIFLMCITLCLVLILLITVGIDVSVKNTAVRAYQEGDYETCYENLKGKNLTESQQVMYGKSESILRIRLWVREYEFFKEQGEEENALDILLLSVRDYPTLYQFSSQYNATDEVAQNYNKILDSLNIEYGIDEDTAKEINLISEDVIYTKIVKAIVSGQDYRIFMDNNSNDSLTEDLSDYLSEEEEFNNDSNN